MRKIALKIIPTSRHPGVEQTEMTIVLRTQLDRPIAVKPPAAGGS
jgi:hypothetical protein